MNTPSTTSFSATDQTGVPWTGFSLTLAVSWMLLLAFSAPRLPADGSMEQEAASAPHAAELRVLTGLNSASLEPTLERWNWQTGLLAKASTRSD